MATIGSAKHTVINAVKNVTIVDSNSTANSTVKTVVITTIAKHKLASLLSSFFILLVLN